MMFRLVRFLIISLTLGRIKWLMRLTWVWRLVVFLGITGWLSKRLRRMIGLDKQQQKSDVDSAWAEALRYTPSPAAPGASASVAAAAPAVPAAKAPVSEATAEVTGYAADGTSETITLHEVSADGETETIVRIADDAGNVETIVTGATVEDIDLASLGSQAAESIDEVVDEIVEAIVEEAAEIDEILDTLEAAEPDTDAAPADAAASAVADPPAPRPKRARKVAEPVETTDEDADPDLALIDPDWVRGDGSHECPESHPVKAKASSMIFYVPESGHYDRTIPDVCFATEIDAEAAGYRAPRR